MGPTVGPVRRTGPEVELTRAVHPPADSSRDGVVESAPAPAPIEPMGPTVGPVRWTGPEVELTRAVHPPADSSRHGVVESAPAPAPSSRWGLQVGPERGTDSPRPSPEALGRATCPVTKRSNLAFFQPHSASRRDAATWPPLPPHPTPPAPRTYPSRTERRRSLCTTRIPVEIVRRSFRRGGGGRRSPSCRLWPTT